MFGLKKILVIVIFISALMSGGCSREHEPAEDGAEEMAISDLKDAGNPNTGYRKIKISQPLAEVFNDSNYLQLQAAEKLGIDPIHDLSTAYFLKRPIVKIESGELYKVDSLTHSFPYLVPEAADLLKMIGKNFIDSMHNRGVDNYKIKVTSLLRTQQSVGSLRKVNINATDSSTHTYGTTFDLSYTNFYNTNPQIEISQEELKNVLGEVLYDLRSQGNCLVKFEIKTGCFHITALK